MSKLLINGFVFKPVESKKRKVSNKPKRTSNKKVYCKCIMSEDNEPIAVCTEIVNGIKSTINRPFSPNSHELKGKLIIFTKTKQQYGRIASIYRTKQEADHFPGVDTQYTPFRNNWVYGGYIIMIEGKKYFDITETVGPIGIYNYLLELEIDEENEK